MSCVWMLQRGHSGDGCVLASTLCKYDLRKGDLFVLSWARVRRVRRGSISSELLVCGGGVRSILLLPLVARCLLLLFAMIRSVVKSFKVPDVEVAAARMSNESTLTCMTDSTPKKTWSDLTLVLDG